MYQKRRPTRRRFNKAEFQPRKLFRYFVGDDVAKSEQRHGPGCDRRSDFSRRRTCSVTTGSRQPVWIEIGRSGHWRLVDGIQVRVVQGPASLDAAKKDPDSTICLAKRISSMDSLIECRGNDHPLDSHPAPQPMPRREIGYRRGIGRNSRPASLVL